MAAWPYAWPALFAKVVGMSEEYKDPAGNTQMFRAFVARNEPDPEPRSKLPLILGLAVAVVVLVVLIVWLVAG